MTWCDGRLPLFVFNIKKIMTEESYLLKILNGIIEEVTKPLKAEIEYLKELNGMTQDAEKIKALREENKRLKEIIKYAQVLLDLDRVLAEDDNNIINTVYDNNKKTIINREG
jgi:cell shape-determining protein MreC